MIRFLNVSKRYGEIVALDNASFEIGKGEIVGLLGPNGAGKTTAMRIITGFLSPNSGEVYVDNVSVFDEPLKTKAMIGYLPETPPLYPEMSVEDYLEFCAQIKGVPKDEIPSRIDEVLHDVAIENRRKSIIGHLSKGLRQRVGIAQALIHSPKVLILDEPTVGLDPIQVIEFRKLIARLKGNRTIILSTHILSEVKQNCERVIIINQGKIVADGKINELEAKEGTGIEDVFLKYCKTAHKDEEVSYE